MGNKGAFITMGSDVKPNFTTYDAVVSSITFALVTFLTERNSIWKCGSVNRARASPPNGAVPDPRERRK